MDTEHWGALAFGAVIGWFVYYVNRYRKGDVQISDVTTLIGAIGGAAVLVLFKNGTAADAKLFGAYGIGLAIGFFGYYISLLMLVAKSPNFDADWFLDGRRTNPGGNIGYGEQEGRTNVGMSLQSGDSPASMAPSAPTQIFNIGRTQDQVPPVQPALPSLMAFGLEGPSDDDPAMPGDTEISETADFDTAKMLANIGAGGIAAEQPAQTMAPAASLVINIDAAQRFLKSCMTSKPRVTYGLGAKVPFHGATPGVHFTKVDCSGFIREAVWLSTNPHVAFPDGSVVQHDWIRSKGFPRGSVADGGLKDGRLRMAFLRPQDSPQKIGHVVLIYNGRTLESHGGFGPNSRDWTAAGWQAKAYVYAIS